MLGPRGLTYRTIAVVPIPILIQPHPPPISTITDQFFVAVREIGVEDLDGAREFLEMAAILIRIKAQMLLPRPGDEDEEDPRAELVGRLLEYEQILGALQDISRVEFKELLAPWMDKMHGVMIPLAGLELSKQRVVKLRQSRPLSELWLLRRDLKAWAGMMPDAENGRTEPERRREGV